MTGYKHYIVKHMVLDENFQAMSARRSSILGVDKPVSEYDISGLRRTLFAVSLCNLHDTWVSELKL